MRQHGKKLIATLAASLVLAILAAAPSLAYHLRPPPPLLRMQKPIIPYAGDCGPNPPPGYRWDLKGWRSGFNRDFYCYMLDEG